MQESKTHFDNMPMLAFKIPIMFRSVGRCSKWVIPWVARKDRRAKNSSLIIYVKHFYGRGEIVFNKMLKGDKGGMNI